MEFGEFKVKEGVYIPDTGIVYPTDDPYRRLVHVEVEDSSKGKYQFDENYPYLDKSLIYKLSDIAGFFIKWVLVALHNRCHFGFQVKGRENLRKHKEQLRDGAMCVCNHVYLFDAFGVNAACQPFRQVRIPMYAKHFNGSGSWILRHAGGIPIPEGDPHATGAFVHTIKEHLKSGGWLQIYAEGSMWEYYAPIRPFKSGIGYFSSQSDKPILPMAFSYREAGLIRKKLFHQPACFTLTIGEPIFPDKNLARKERETDLVLRAHEAVCRLAGIEPENNIYPPIFENTERIDYYKTKNDSLS